VPVDVLDASVGMLSAALFAGAGLFPAFAILLGLFAFLTLPIKPLAKGLILVGLANEIRGLVMVGGVLRLWALKH
jgi:hypothetical protein